MESVWSLQGTLEQHIYSPKGEVEGLLLMAKQVPVQFVVAPEHRADAAALKAGQRVELEGTVRPPSHKGEAAHDLYDLVAIRRVGGKPMRQAAGPSGRFAGIVKQFNYAKHGEPNGYILDSGDFVHTKPQGFKQLGLALGDRLDGCGAGKQLASGAGWAYEAEEVNGTALA